MPQSLFGYILVWMITGYALYTDMRYRRVTNRTIVCGLVTGFLYSTYCGSGILLSGIAGAALALAINLVPFTMGLLGGGDVKLMMVIGLYTGPHVFMEVFVVTAIVGAIISIVVMMWSGDFFRTMKRMQVQLMSMIIGAKVMQVDEPKQPTSIPYVLAISMGLLYSTYHGNLLPL